ncbi:YezD family protein [Paenibacillus sp. FSL H8-0034]|uniref:YezD family protein n=1 Tax=Paenibacillus sp. FSL H8-0034 TaxID=2954671 RepID=UPI0030F5B8F6
MAKPLEVDDIWTQRILNSVNGLEYGTVQIVIHDGRIVQIERTERKRFEAETGTRDREHSGVNRQQIRKNS